MRRLLWLLSALTSCNCFYPSRATPAGDLVAMATARQVNLSGSQPPVRLDFAFPARNLLDGGAFRLTLTALSEVTSTHPVLATLQHRESSLSLAVTGRAAVSRTLCPPLSLLMDPVNVTTNETASLTLSCQSESPIPIEVVGRIFLEFTLWPGSRLRVSVESPDSPQLLGLRLQSGADAVLGVQSTPETGHVCARVTLHKHRCSTGEQQQLQGQTDGDFASVDGVGFISSQTVLSSGHLVVRGRPTLESPIQLVTLQVSDQQTACELSGSSGIGVASSEAAGPIKNLTLSLDSVTPFAAVFPVTLSAVCFLLLLGIAPVAGHICWRYAKVEDLACQLGGPDQREMSNLNGSRGDGDCDCPTLPVGAVSLADVCGRGEDQGGAAEEVDVKRQTLYCFHVGVVAVFYSLPALQLVLASQAWLHESGDHDQCYYNFACLLPVSVLGYTIYASNSVASNLGYVILGVAFLICTWVHRTGWQRRRLPRSHGVPPSHGLHCAAGFGMIAEGLLSAGYHMCPSSVSFQFDTAFMLVLAGLLATLVLAKRRPGLRPPAHWGCLIFACLILLNTLGSAGSRSARALAFAATGCLLLFGARFTYLEAITLGAWRHRRGATLGSAILAFLLPACLRRGGAGCCGAADRVSIVFQACFSCLCMLESALAFAAAVWASPPYVPYGMFLLACLLLNIVCYLVYYLGRKLASLPGSKCRSHRRRRGVSGTAMAASVVCLAIALTMWGLALYLFLRAPTDWKVSPAQSRERNSRCAFMGYFDVHDLWHFASALALFFSFLFLLTIDDDVANVPRDKLEVF